MGCCRSKHKSEKKKLVKADSNSNFSYETYGQDQKLKEILRQVESEIQMLKEGKLLLKSNSGDPNEEYLLLRKRSCYLSQLLIFIKWTIKVRQVNQVDKNFNEIIKQMSKLIENDDEFLINSLENKIRHLLNKKEK